MLVTSIFPFSCNVLKKTSSSESLKLAIVLERIKDLTFVLIGENIPAPAIVPWMIKEDFRTRHILAAVFTLACGVFLGYFLLAFWPLKKKLYGSLLWMGAFLMVLGLVTLQIPVFDKKLLSYVAVYMAILGAVQGN